MIEVMVFNIISRRYDDENPMVGLIVFLFGVGMYVPCRSGTSRSRHTSSKYAHYVTECLSSTICCYISHIHLPLF